MLVKGATEALLLTYINFSTKMDNNHIFYKVRDEIIYPFANFNCATVEIREWMSTLLGMWLLIHAEIKANPC